jgi:hypothetical protein
MVNALTAIDEDGATILLDRLSNAAGTLTTSGSGQWWMFSTNYTLTATLDTGRVDLIVPNKLGIEEFRVNWRMHAMLYLDLNKILPPIYLPQIKITIKWKKWKLIISISITWVHYPWPTVGIPLNFGDHLTASANLQLLVRNDATNWYVLAKMLGVPNFNYGLATAGLVAAVGLVLGAVLWPIPFIGPFLGIAVASILTGLAAAGAAGLLAAPVSLLLQGREFMLYQRPRHFPLLPYAGPNDPAVSVKLALVRASIVNSGEDELVISTEFQN